jgi:hypothetical protein
MYKIQPVINHIEKVYGLELAPCSIPRSQFQYFKRYFYLFIYNKVSQKLFYFLRDNISSIKYLEERPDREIWFRKRNSEGRISIEVEIKPVPLAATIYLSHDSGLFKPLGDDYNYKVKIYHQLNGTEHISFPLNHINGIEQVDYYFSKEDELKQVLRDYKLKNILS